MPSFVSLPSSHARPHNLLVTRYSMDRLLEKMEAHLSPRRPGSRGEPELRRYVLLSNTFRAAQTDLVSSAPPAPLKKQEPAFDLYSMMDEDDDDASDEMWLQSCLDELVRADEEMEHMRQQELVLYRDQQVPDALYDEDEDDDEEANLSMESQDVDIDAPWMDDGERKGWPVDPLAVDDGGGGLFGEGSFAF